MPGNGAPAGGMMLSPDMLQQMGQGGQGMGMLPIPGMTMMSLPHSMPNVSPGIGLPPQLMNLPPGVNVITPEMLNNLPPQQKQMLWQQIQQGMNKMQMGGMGLGGAGQFTKKEEEKK